MGVLPSAPKEAITPPLHDGPDIVGSVKHTSLNSHDKGDPLIVCSVRGIIFTFNALKLYYALQMGLVLGRDVGGPVDPAEILGEIRVDTLELTTDRISKVLSGDTNGGSCHADHG